MMIYILVMFITPSVVSSRIGVCTALGVAVALEYVYIWFAARGRYFTIPLSFLPILLLGAFYFNNPSNPDMNLGMWVLAKYLVLPYAAASCVISAVMYFVKKRMQIKKEV
jgi:phosphoglycerol transferase MdoB-like AlkP superfamily enzyme